MKKIKRWFENEVDYYWIRDGEYVEIVYTV